MEKIIIIRYSEIHLKGKNRNYFERIFEENIKFSLKGCACELVKISGRFLVSGFESGNEAFILNALKKVFGVHSLSVAHIVDSDINKIFDVSAEICRKEGSFKCETNRADKKFIPSVEVSKIIGGMLLEKFPKLKVNVINPDFKIYIDIRENGKTLVYSEVIQGPGGMPVGCAGRGLLLLSGGIDSPAAGYLMAKRGMKIHALHFHSFPYTSERAKDKVKELVRLLSAYTNQTKLTIINVAEIQEAINEHCPQELMITILRRFMMKIAEKIAFENKCGALITGESLGQVASQTIESITCTGSVVKLPVLRPLIGFDKYEIIEIANKIGTYETSVQPYEDCCTVFLPKHPAIRPDIRTVERAESKLDVEGLISRAMNTVES